MGAIPTTGSSVPTITPPGSSRAILYVTTTDHFVWTMDATGGGTVMRGSSAGGSTLSRYSGGCRSKSSHDGMLTTRALTPSATSFSYAFTTSETSVPVPISTTCGFASDSASTYAPFSTPLAAAYFVR